MHLVLHACMAERRGTVRASCAQEDERLAETMRALPKLLLFTAAASVLADEAELQPTIPEVRRRTRSICLTN
eukprot:SAG22_NODE_271_length_13227_cov_34.282983_9_plen_72_part_00